MPSSGFSCGVCLKHAVPHRWFRTVLVPQVRSLGIVTIDAQGILPEKKLVDSRCLRAPPASKQRVRSPAIQLAVGKLLRELRRPRHPRSEQTGFGKEGGQTGKDRV